MRAAIEKLTRLVPMTELFTDAGVRQRQDTGNIRQRQDTDNITRARFNEVLSETQTAETPESPVMTRRREKPVEAEKTEEEKDETEAEGQENSVAGLFGQNSVVFILEGEKEEESQLQTEDETVTIRTEGGTIEGKASVQQETHIPAEAAETAEDTHFAMPEDTQAAPPEEKESTTGAAIPEVKTETKIKPETEEKAEAVEESETGKKTEAVKEPEVGEKAETVENSGTRTDDAGVKQETKRADNIEPETESTPVTNETDGSETRSAERAETESRTAAHEEKQEPEKVTEPETKNVTETKPTEPGQTARTDAKTAERPEEKQPETRTITAREVQAAAEENNAQVQNHAAEPKEDTAPELEHGEARVRERSGAAETAAKPAGGNETDADSGEAVIDATGKTMARTPETKTAEQSGGERQETDKSFSENGELCPLENENDETPVEGKKTYKTSETTQTHRETKKEITQKPTDGTTEQNVTDFTSEKFQATQQIREAVKMVQQTPVPKENLFEAMVERIDMMKTADTQQMSIRLNPDFLGDVTLNITMDAAGLHVKIGAGNREVSGMINAQINSLIETLSNKGIEVAKIEVAYSGVEHHNANNTPQERQQEQSSGRSKRGQGGRRIESTAYYAVSALEEMTGYLDMGVSSVEYRA